MLAKQEVRYQKCNKTPRARKTATMRLFNCFPPTATGHTQKFIGAMFVTLSCLELKVYLFIYFPRFLALAVCCLILILRSREVRMFAFRSCTPVSNFIISDLSTTSFLFLIYRHGDVFLV